MDELIKIIIGISGTVLGGFLGYFIRVFLEHKLATDRIKENIKITEFNKASSVFRAAFVDAQFSLLGNIKDERRKITEIITPEVLASHEKAKIMFEPFINSSDLSSFNAAWENYKNHYKDYYRKEGVFVDGGGRKDECEYCLKQISLLLDFAKPKI